MHKSATRLNSEVFKALLPYSAVLSYFLSHFKKEISYILLYKCTSTAIDYYTLLCGILYYHILIVQLLSHSLIVQSKILDQLKCVQ